MAQKITRDDSDCTEVLMAGVPYNFDDRAGRWSPWNLSNFIDGAEFFGRKTGNFMDYKTVVTENVMYPRILQTMTINPVVYTYNFLKKAQLKITTNLEKIGNTSVIIRSKLTDVLSGTILADRYIIVVQISAKTRKPVKYPEWFEQKYSYLKETPVPQYLMFKSETPEAPAGCFIYKTIVRYSDLDYNAHTNQSVYVKMCLDCATAASCKGLLVSFNRDISLYPLVYFNVRYLGETFTGDELKINFIMGCASSTDTGTEFIQFEKKKPLNNDNAVVITPRPSSIHKNDKDDTIMKTTSENSDLSLSPSTNHSEREDTIMKTKTENSNPSPIDQKDREDTMLKSDKSDMSEHNRPKSQYLDDGTNKKQDDDRPQSFHQNDSDKKSPDQGVAQSRESSTKDVMIVNTASNEEKERKPSSSSSSSEDESDDDTRDSDTRLLATRDSETRFTETNDHDDNRDSQMNGYTPIGSETNDHKTPDSETNEREMNDDGVLKTGDVEKDEADANLNNVGTAELTKPVAINETTESIQPEETHSSEEGAANDILTKNEEIERTNATEGESVVDTEIKAETNDTSSTEKRDNGSSENGLISSKEVDSTENNSEKSPQEIDHTEEEDMPFT